MPAPDWAAFYPFYDTDSPGSPTEEWHPRYSTVGNFSRATLEFLAQRGLESSAFDVLRREDSNVRSPSDCGCFPWLIVEHAKGGEEARQCYVRAANSGSAGVLMFRQLSKYTPRKSADAHIPPVVVMTTVAQAVRIWVTYSCNLGMTIVSPLHYASWMYVLTFPAENGLYLGRKHDKDTRPCQVAGNP